MCYNFTKTDVYTIVCIKILNTLEGIYKIRQTIMDSLETNNSIFPLLKIVSFKQTQLFKIIKYITRILINYENDDLYTNIYIYIYHLRIQRLIYILNYK